MRKEPKDLRSTSRKRARKVLQLSNRPYECECLGCVSDACKATETEACKYTPEIQSRSQTLDVNHKSKQLRDNDPSNLEWLCRPCHRAKDRRTEKGVAHSEETAKLYGEGFFL